MNKQQYIQMSRKYRNRAGDAGFVDAAKLRAAGDERGADLAKQAHDIMCKLFRHLEEKMDL